MINIKIKVIAIPGDQRVKCDPEEAHKGFSDIDAALPFNMSCCCLNDLKDVKMWKDMPNRMLKILHVIIKIFKD